MRSFEGYQLKETLFTITQTEVFRATRESDGESVIIRTLATNNIFNDANPSAAIEQASHSKNISLYSRLAFTQKVLTLLDHPNIVKALDWVDGPQQTYLVMEDIHGVDLWLYVERFENKQVPLTDFLKLAIQLADALSVVHLNQVIHKDLHPGNIIINPDTGLVQIIDFGLASLLSREQPALATPDRLEGILAYISPEQSGRMNRALDYRCDFYTLGITFYQLLTGKLPFEADDALGMVYAHMAIVQQPAKDLRPEIPTSLSKLIDKLMDKNAEGRYQSALGLKHDLQRCWDDIEKNGLSTFDLGEQDISSYFSIPQVLYGREREIQTLMQHFHLAAAGQPQLLTVAGYSGIGKSALVHEVHKPIAAHSGLFMQGKFDQFQKNVPFSAFKRALAGWVQTTLSLKESALSALREQLKQTLGANARVLIDFMPDFQHVLGDLPALPELGAQENQNRLYLVMQRFIQLISQFRPLVIFIDDLQWADRGTLNLLPELLSESACRLFVIVAYRDNEVDATHPVTHMLKTLKNLDEHNQQRHQNEQGRNDQRNEAHHDSASNVANEASKSRVSELRLGPLPFTQVQQLLSDALHRSEHDVRPLAELVLQKTGGNPFFSIEFLKKLYSESLLSFDLQRQQWQWSLDAINAKGITDNVVELMLGKMQSLPSETQHILQLAACVGTYFDIETLAMLAETDMSEVAHALWPALQEGLLIQEGGDWFLGMLGKRPALSSALTPPSDSNTKTADKTNSEHRQSPWVPRCKFLHDRMLQAAYESLNEQERQQTHLNIGRLLFAHSNLGRNDAAPLENHLFGIIEQLNQGRTLIQNQSEQLHLAQLNLLAAEKAKHASVWEAAVDYAQVGLALLHASNSDENETKPTLVWQNHYALSFGLTKLLAETLYLSGDVKQSEMLYDELLVHCDSDLDKAQLCATRLVQTIGRGQWQKGIDYGIAGLQHLGITIPTAPAALEALLQEEKTRFEQALLITPLDQFIALPEMSDPALLIASSIIPNLSQCGYILGQLDFQKCCTLAGLNLTINSGKSDLTPILLACHAIQLARDNLSTQAYEVAKQAIRISENYPNCRELANTYNMLAGLVIYLKSPYQEAIELHQLGYELGMENGEIARATLNFCNLLFLKISRGDELNVIQEDNDLALALIKRKAIFFPGQVQTSYFIKALADPYPEGIKALDDEKFEPEYLAKVKSGFHFPVLLHYRSQLAFWYGDYKRALNIAEQVQAKIDLIPKFSFYIDHLLQYALLLLSQTNKPTNQKDLDYCQDKLQALAILYPPNFEHKYRLLQAELGCHQKHAIDEVSEHYEAAIASAEQHGFLQYQALAHELYADFWLKKKRPRYAELHLKDAIQLYNVWGCRVKVDQLQQRYQDLFATITTSPKLSHPTTSLSESNFPLATIQNASRPHSSLTTSLKSTPLNSLAGLDLSSVMKSAQLISGELTLDKLLSKVMQVIVESAGAQHAAFILKRDQGVNIEAQLHHIQGKTKDHINLSTRPLNSAKDLPVSLIDYVLRSENKVLLQEGLQAGINAHTENNKSVQAMYADDPYLQCYQPQSVLCLPIKYRDQLLGALYLENTLSSHAFPKARLDIINMLLSQAAISLENARMFTEISTLNASLETKVLSKTKKLSDALNVQEALNDKILKKTEKLDAANKKLTILTITDALTGAFSRRHFLELADKEIARARRYQHNTVVLMLDIDWFKKVNDKFGHAAGDEALQKVSAACLESLRQQDIFGRLGGEEFAILLPETDISAGLEIAERIRQTVADLKIKTTTAALSVTVSIGLAQLSLKDQAEKDEEPAQDINALLHKADFALYQSKEKGRNQVTLA
jgi:diguanylate cyclase (GGDEF)-like protein